MVELEPRGPNPEQPEEEPDDGTTVGAQPVFGDADLPWRPFCLRRRVLFFFAAVFALIIIAIQALLAVSDKNYGLISADSSQHYLWTYGPTAFLTLVAAVWTRTEYQSKLVAPWLRMSKQLSHAKHSILLDYLSDFQLYAVFKALGNRDFNVSITCTVAIIIKLLIILSTGLLTLSWTQVHLDSWPMTVQDRFVDSNARLSDTGNLAYFIMLGLASQKLTYPNGMNHDYAFQSVKADLPETAETRVTVDGFKTSLEYQPAELGILDSLLPDPGDVGQRWVMNVTITSPECNLQRVLIDRIPEWRCNGCPILFVRFSLMQCDGTPGDAGKRVLVLFGNLTYTDQTPDDINRRKKIPISFLGCIDLPRCSVSQLTALQR